MERKKEVERIIKMLVNKYHAEYAILFGSYARGEETDDQLTQKDVDAFEIREVNKGTKFYENVMREGVRIA